MVGVNAYTEGADLETDILRIDPEFEVDQVRRLQALRERRSAGPVTEALVALEQAARGDENLMPYLLEAARAEATEGEMIQALQRVFGTYTESPVF